MTLPSARFRGRYLGYNALLSLLSPVVATVALARDLKRGGPSLLPDRFGRPQIDRRAGSAVWIHAASVGETVAAAPIVRALMKLRPDVQIFFSNITVTGHEAALRELPHARQFYFPLDFPMAIRSAFARIRPDVCVTVETELWPNFIHLGRSQGVRMAVVNGRISDRTFRRASHRPIRPVFEWMLQGIEMLAMQTDLDAERAIALGADPARVQVIGNSKFDQALDADLSPETVAREMGFPAGALTIVAGSTHAGEDEMVLDAFVTLRQTLPGARLIIAPRRLERVPEIQALLTARGLSAEFRSDPRGTLVSDAPVLVLDTLGELRKVYALGRAAFVGGSLVPVGGHDLLQPLSWGCPVLFGPHVHNQREIASIILKRGAGARVAGSAELAAACLSLLQNPVEANRMGQSGLDLVRENAGASARYAQRIADLLPPAPGGPA